MTSTIPVAVSLPEIIQGGMGVGVSGWRLARAVSTTGQLGVVSGTMIDVVIARQLQLGDQGCHLRRALAAYPCQEVARRFLDRYFIPGGKAADAAYKTVPMSSLPPSKPSLEFSILSTFVSIWLAKENHDGVVGLNLLEKSQIPTMPLLYGAMLAGVDFVLMGAGIPRQIPGVLDRLAENLTAELRLDVTGATEPVILTFDPPAACGFVSPPLKRPKFLAVVSSPVLAENLRRKASGKVDGFVVEFPTAGGHNAPPRGGVTLGDTGEPVYGPRDQIDVGKFRDIGLPFWLAGGFGQAGKLREARALGATGIQVGTAFALSGESGFDPGLKSKILDSIRRQNLRIFTDPAASPTGFPFKVANVPGTLAESGIYDCRDRICDIGVLRELFMKADGSVGFRCSAEPVDTYVAKGGDVSRTIGAKCLCNSLGASIGLGQPRSDGAVEAPIVTLGDDIASIRALLPEGSGGYSAGELIGCLLR
jgi:NAD(P)H-dependent flavin oxidoreductase YrpB (nitropropane dioxygenase family)